PPDVLSGGPPLALVPDRQRPPPSPCCMRRRRSRSLVSSSVFITLNSTRRFWAMPSTVLLLATGTRSPNPLAEYWSRVIDGYLEDRSTSAALERLLDRA